MNQKPYLLLSAVIFGLVGIMHLMRAINGWVFQLNTWMVPVSISWIAGLVALGLSIYGFRLASR